MRDAAEIAKVVKDTLSARFGNVDILKVIVTPHDYEDDFLNVMVIYDGTPDDLDISKVVGAVGEIRSKLDEIGEPGFPLLSYVAKSDASKRELA